MVEQPALGHLGGGGDGVEGCGAFSGVNQQVDVGVEDVLARVIGSLFAVVGSAHGYQSNRLKLYRPVGIVNLRLLGRAGSTPSRTTPKKTGRADAAPASATSAETQKTHENNP